MDAFTFNSKKNEFGEYVIRCYRNGKRYPDVDYHTSDLNDAIGTLKLLQERAKNDNDLSA